MRRTKEQKGITLIALIITIVVLLILAVVAINSIQNDGILSHAGNVANTYNQSVKKEEETLQNYLHYLDNANGGGSAIGDATVGTKVTKLSTINGEAYSANNPVIPAGFIAINDGANWDATDLAAEVKKGLVISDGTSEFVWIPVAEINSFARLQTGSETNYRGVLYDWTNDSTGKTEYTWSLDSTSIREPIDTSYDNATELSIWTENLYQESFNKMVKSVSKYKGFYVGRYETSLNGTTAQSKSEELPMKSLNWFRMYENSKAYSTSNSSLGVVSEMIWGCQWDAMLKFILTGSEASHVTATTNVSHDLSSAYQTGGTNYSGTVEYNDIASNIYDLEGNMHEWTQASRSTEHRDVRGGAYNFTYTPCYCPFNPTPGASGDFFGSRLSLYINL